MNRADFRKLAHDRLADAKALLAAKRWAGAYYLAGYSVECGLKSCIIAWLMRTDQFPEKKFSEQCWTHDLGRLLVLAGLKTAFDADAASDPELWDNWDTVKDRDEARRYVRTTKAEAEELYEAIADKKRGVFSWIKKYW